MSVVGRVAVFVVLAACWKPFAPSRPTQRTLTLPIRSYRLDNGLRVVVLPDPMAVEVQVTLRLEVGSTDDPSGREGMAHLAEHLTFGHVIDGESLFAQLERSASSFNGLTELDTTTYVQRGAPSNLERFLGVEAARLRLPCKAIGEEVFAREREVVRNELREKSILLGTQAAILQGLFAAGHPYHRSVDTDDTVGKLNLDETCAFIDAHYSPANAVLVVSGSFAADSADASVRRIFATVPKRAVAAHRPIPRPAGSLRVTSKAPIDDAALVFGWPLPADPVERARVRALAWILADHVREEIEGDVFVREYGGDRAPMLAVIAVPDAKETLQQVRTATEHEITLLPTSFDNAKYYDNNFAHARQVGVYRLFATFEDGGGREEHLADHFLADRDPAEGLRLEIQALETMERDAAGKLAQRVLALDRANVLTLEPASKQKTGRPVRFDGEIHDAGQQRVVEDPARAQQPSLRRIANPLANATTRMLPNGTKLVLLPLSGVPTVEIRFVFAAGTGDEPADQRGIALATAQGLNPQLIDIQDIIHFYEAGGSFDRNVGLDHTTFRVQGLEGQLDILLIGLERLMRGGDFRKLPEVAAHLRAAELSDPDDAADAAWRSSVHGSDQGKLGDLGVHAADTFRALHYQPSAMTIIIAGGFDAGNASQWVDHIFGTWSGSPSTIARQARPAKLVPAAIAAPEDTTLVRVQIALPIRGSRAEMLVATALIDQAIGDVRHQLGATYDLGASLAESRLSSRIEITGYVDASRASEALALLRERLAGLRAATNATASQFVSARDHVLARATSLKMGAAGLANLAERSTALGLGVTMDVDAAEIARKLTLPDLAKQLQAIDLERSAIVLRGPREVIVQAFATLGRKPRILE